MKATQVGVQETHTQGKLATYANGQLQIVQGEARMNFDIRREEKVAEFKKLCGARSEEVYTLLMQGVSPVKI